MATTTVVTSYGIALRPSGRSLIGLCPRHDDKRPSLYVYPDTHSWWCFACKEGGDNIQFVRFMDHVDFVAACRMLEGLSAVSRDPVSGAYPPQMQTGRSRPDHPRWEHLRLAEQIVMNTTCAVYRDALWREPRALDYVRARGIPDWVTRGYGLGYADGHSLGEALHTESELRTAAELGLLRQREASDSNRFREFLAGRIVIPEIRSGNCIWFIGRSIDQRSERVKYLAVGGERPVLGLEAAAGRREVFLCEGVFDWLTAISWKLAAFSPCGTHLPSDRLGFLARTEIVWGVLDGDEAGRAAAEGFAQQLGNRFRPIRLPDGLDLNDLGQEPEGERDFFRLVAQVRSESGAGLMSCPRLFGPFQDEGNSVHDRASIDRC